jgi:Tfp pilus assembly protein PilO
MINFRDPAARVTSVISVISVLVLFAVLLSMWLIPKPTTRGMAIERREREFDVRLKTKKAQDQTKEYQAEVDRFLWRDGPDQVGPKSLARITAIAKARKLELVGFRPQRQVDDAVIPRLPFLLTVEGAYPAVIDLVKALEQPDVRLAVTSVQLASSDGASDRVTASIGLAALLNVREASSSGGNTRG